MEPSTLSFVTLGFELLLGAVAFLLWYQVSGNAKKIADHERRISDNRTAIDINSARDEEYEKAVEKLMGKIEEVLTELHNLKVELAFEKGKNKANNQ